MDDLGTSIALDILDPVIAYRLIAVLVYLLMESGYREQWETRQKLLDFFSGVERMEITFGRGT